MTHTEANSLLVDLHELKRERWIDRTITRLFRAHVNRFAKSVISRAVERGLINSFTFHELAAIIDHSLWPERYKDREKMARLIHK